MNVADKEWRVEHITGGLSRNDAVVDAVPFVYGVPIVAGAASRVRNRSLPLVFASANHILPTIVLEDLLRTRKSSQSRHRRGTLQCGWLFKSILPYGA